MTKNDHKKKLFALALRLQKKFGPRATEGIMMRLTGGDKEAVYLLRRHMLRDLPYQQRFHAARFYAPPTLTVEDALRERERKMTKRNRKTR